MAMSPMEIVGSAEVSALSDFGACFETFRVEAFRFECLPEYFVDEEADAFRAYVAGQDRPANLNIEWINLLQAAKTRGAQVKRVRLLPRPKTEYVKFEYYWGYKPQREFGEEIRLVEPTILKEINNLPLAMDYWLFDRNVGFLMIYDLAGRFLGVLALPTRLSWKSSQMTPWTCSRQRLYVKDGRL
jgi:hypothetical protein